MTLNLCYSKHSFIFNQVCKTTNCPVSKMIRFRVLLPLVAIAVGLAPITDASRILFLYPVSTKSETNLFLPFAQTLASRGHQVTVVTPVKSSSLPPGMREIVPTAPAVASDFMHRPVLEERAHNLRSHKAAYLLEFDPQILFDKCHEVLSHPEFEDLYKTAKHGDYDLVVMSGFFQTCFEGLIHKTQAPFIIITSMPTPAWVSSIATGFHQPPSFVPIPLIENEDAMSFWDRFGNVVTTWLFTALNYYVFYPTFDSIGREYMGPDIPPSELIERNVSMVFSHAHFALTFPRPMLPDSIEIGGIHCRPPKPLPQDLEAFVSGAKDGVILFSLGSVVQAHELPAETMQIFLRVFSRLPQRVLWKFETEKMDNLPSNVKLSKWLPQQDILGHPKTKLFISHGGLLSTMESAYHAVPVLAMPIFVDQNINVNNIRKLGYSMTLEILELNEADLERTIRAMLADPSYKERALEISSRFRDQPQTPMERAVYWAEYVIRHKGAHHLRSAARKLTWAQSHSLDVVAFLAAVIAGILGAIVWTCKKCWRCVWKSKPVSVANGTNNGNRKKNQ